MGGPTDLTRQVPRKQTKAGSVWGNSSDNLILTQPSKHSRSGSHTSSSCAAGQVLESC